MKKKLMALVLGAVISLQGICSGSVVINAEDNGISSVDRVIQLEYDESAEPVEIEIYEGEQIQLDLGDIPENYDSENIRYHSSNKKVVISHSEKMVGCAVGEDKVAIGVNNKTTADQLVYTLLVNVLPNDSISDKNRAELDRLNDFKYDDYRRRKMELLGVADENAPRLTIDKIQEFIDNSENYIDIIKKVNNYIEYPDHVSSKGHESYSYWSDPKGNETISIGYDRNYIGYTKIADDGTVIGAQILYPEKEEFYENGKDKCQEYMDYNQITPVVDRVIHLEQADYNDELITIELVEGEAVQLDFQLDPEIYDLEYIQCFGSEKVVVSHTGKMIAYDSGQEIVKAYVKVRDHFHTLDFAFNVNVLPNENISPENRAELKRLQDFWYMDYRRRKLELVGAIDEDAPRLTLEKVQEFIDTGEDYREIFKKVSNYVGYPDDVSGSGATSYAYWSDPKGNECIYIGYDEEYIAYTKIADDGTYIGSQMLYPEKTEFAEDGKGKDSQYIKYNQIKPEGYGTLKLKFIDESTGEAFTETNGTFQLMAKPLEGDEDEIEFKSWETSADSTIIIEELPRDLFYTLVYNDEYHTDEQGRLYKYEIDTHKQTNKYSFHYQDYYNFNVYLKRHYSTDPQKVTMGDINMDNKLTIADVAVVQKWLLGGSFYGSDIQFDYWHLADFCDDDKLDVFDLCLMKEKLLENGESAELPTLEEISKMSDEEATELFSKYTFKEIWCIWGEFDWGFSGLYGGGWVVGDKEISLVFNYYTDELESARIGTIPK